MQLQKKDFEGESDKLLQDNKNQQIQSQQDQQKQNINMQNENLEQQQQPQRFSMFKMIFIYFIISNIIGMFKPQQNNPYSIQNFFQNDDQMQIEFTITNKQYPFLKENIIQKWTESQIYYNYEQNNTREKLVSITQQQIDQNDQIYVFAKLKLINTEKVQQRTQNMSQQDKDKYSNIIAQTELLVMRKVKQENKQNLIYQNKSVKISDEQIEIKKEKQSQIKHIRNEVYFQIIHDTNVYDSRQIPIQIQDMGLEINQKLNIFKPILDSKQFWCRMYEKVGEKEVYNLRVKLNVYWSWKYLLEQQMENHQRVQAEWGLDQGDHVSNLDEIKDMILDTNPYFLLLTIIVYFLHSIFEFLAIKNEVQYWRNLKSAKGLSLRALYVDLVMEIIIFLYLWDEDAQKIILIPSGINILVTMWKVGKMTKFKRITRFPYIQLDYQESYEGITEQYDREATRYLMYLMVPLFFGYVVYSVIYEEHKGWFSFILKTLVGFIYVFGFIQMTPQLYINYKLKSVEHMNWRVMGYKFLNTIIDDLFAFIIKMPWLKRLSVFRDDLIFIIYLYQRWIYRVDKNRTETGFISQESEIQFELELKKEKEVKEEPNKNEQIKEQNKDQNKKKKE